MEYYQGYLMRADSVRRERRPGSVSSSAKRADSEIHQQIRNMKSRLQQIESKYRMEEARLTGRLPPSPLKVAKPGKVSAVPPPPCTFSEDIRLQNKQLREENKLLNDYFTVFELRYAQQKRELEQLRSQNQFLKSTLNRNPVRRSESISTLQTPSQYSYKRLQGSKATDIPLIGLMATRTVEKPRTNMLEQIDTPSKLSCSPQESLSLQRAAEQEEEELLI